MALPGVPCKFDMAKKHTLKIVDTTNQLAADVVFGGGASSRLADEVVVHLSDSVMRLSHKMQRFLANFT